MSATFLLKKPDGSYLAKDYVSWTWALSEACQFILGAALNQAWETHRRNGAAVVRLENEAGGDIEMKLFLLVRKDLRAYDDYSSVLVRASTSDVAREVAVAFVKAAQAELDSEGFDYTVWEDPSRSDVRPVVLLEEAQVLHASFRHG